MTTSKKLAKNSIYSLFGFVVTFPILILLTPYMLKILGNTQFGIWALAGVVTSYAQLSDMGMTTAIVKFIAESWITRDIERINRVVSTAFFVFALIGGFVVLGTISLRYIIVNDLLKVPEALQNEALFVVIGVILIFYFNLLFGVYNAILQGIQRIDISNSIMVGSKIIRAFGMYIFLLYGFGLKGLIINSAILSVITVSISIFFSNHLVKGLKVNPKFIRFNELKEIINYSINIFFAKFVGLAQDPINKVFIATFTALESVSFFEIGVRIKIMVRQLFQVALLPLLPASSELHSVNKNEELENIYFKVSRFLFMFALPFFLIVIILAKPLVSVWLGDGYELAAFSIQMLLIGSFFSLLVTPQYIILQGIGKPQVNTYGHLIGAISNIILVLALVYFFDFFGILVATTLALIVASVYTDVMFRRNIEIQFRAYVKNISLLSISMITVLCAGILIYLITFVNNWNFLFIIIYSFGYGIIYLLFLIIFGVLSKQDYLLFVKVFHTLRHVNES